MILSEGVGNMTTFGVKSALRRGVKRSLLLGAAVAASFATPNLASADEVFQLFGHVRIDGAPLTSFDISWVNSDLSAYFLADRSHAAVDIIGILPGNSLGLGSGQVVLLVPQGANAFTGNAACPASIVGAGANDCKGPNGILTLTNTVAGKTLWAGNGNSTVEVFDAANLNVPIATINTGGKRRADEMCWDPDDNILMVANDAEVDAMGHPAPFVTFIGTDNPNAYQVIGRITFDGSQGTPKPSKNVATNGIEQCQYDHHRNKFFVNIPEVNGNGVDDAAGEVAVINPKLMVVEGEHSVDLRKCAGPQGMAYTPFNEVLLGCNAQTLTDQTPNSGDRNSVVVETASIAEESNADAEIVCTLDKLGGADEVWFNPADDHFFLALSSATPNQLLGVVDARSCNPDPGDFSETVVTAVGNARTNHSVAADFSTGFVGLPVAAGPIAGYSSDLCGGDAVNGCVAVLASSDNPFITGEPVSEEP